MNKEIILDIKQKPGKYLGFIIGMFFVAFFVLHNIGSNNKKVKKNISETKTILKSKTKINQKTNKKEKLLMATNPEARRAELSNKLSQYNNINSTVLKNKYSNSPTAFNETVMKINKRKNEENKNILKLKIELAKQKELLKNKEIELANTRKKLLNINNHNKYNIKKFKPKTVIKPEIQKKLLLEALGTKIKNNKNNIENNVYVVYTKKTNSKINNFTTTNNNVTTKNIRFNIIPGSSFYGRLETPIYSQYTDIDAIITINNHNFNNCKFIGKVKYLKYKGLTININKVACSDGYVQQLNAKALRIKDLKPIFSDSIDRHILPKVVLGSLDTLINLTRIRNTTTADGGTVIVSKNSSLIDEILKDEYNRVKEDEEMANPQSLVVIFY